MLDRHNKPKKIVFHSRLLPHETCAMKRMQQSRKTSAVAGYCPTAIYEAAAKQGSDLIVISTHGRTGLRHALLGSVAEGTVRHGGCPVLVVPSDPKARFVNRRSQSTSATTSAARDLK